MQKNNSRPQPLVGFTMLLLVMLGLVTCQGAFPQNIIPDGAPDIGAPPSPASGSTPPSSQLAPALPLRVAIYYPWFPKAWTQKETFPYTNFRPALGYYDSGDTNTIRQHIQAMQYGNIQAGIVSWWGKATLGDANLARLLEETREQDFQWAIYYEPEGTGNPPPAQIASDLLYLSDRYGDDPAYLRLDGRMVVFVFTTQGDDCELMERWKKGNTINAYLVPKVFAGYRQCSTQSDGWHQYAPGNAVAEQKGFSYSISPGFWKAGEQPRLERDLTRWNESIRSMIASKAPFQLITSFNEWGEGTAVEAAEEWASPSGYGAYLDALHDNGASVLPITATAVVATATPAPVQPPTVSVAKTPTAPESPASPTAVVPTILPPSNAAQETIIVAVGDIACEKNEAGLCNQDKVADLTFAIDPDAALLLGDIQYECGLLVDFYKFFDVSWRRLQPILHPVPGNHEYNTNRIPTSACFGLPEGAPGYYTYFGAAASPLEPECRAGCSGYYSFDLGAWHLIALNSNCGHVGGCGADSPQLKWLQNDLAAHPKQCTLAYWHHPRFSSGKHGNQDSLGLIYKRLYDAGADVVLAGHDHIYERFGPLDPSGEPDPARGIRNFVVGTGGRSHYAFSFQLASSEARNADTYGVLKLTLRDSGYTWEFVPEAGKTFTDSGSDDCH